MLPLLPMPSSYVLRCTHEATKRNLGDESETKQITFVVRLTLANMSVSVKELLWGKGKA